MSINLATQTVGFQPALITYDDATPNQGGAISTTQILNVVRGEWFPKMQAKATGTLYNAPDLAVQYQKTFIGHNDATLSLPNASIFIANGVKTPASGMGGFITLTSTDTRDNSTYRGLFQVDIAGSLNTAHSVILNGTTGSTGTAPVNRIFRGELQNATTGAHYDPYGLIEIKINGAICGYFIPGCGWVTSEIKIALPITTSEAGENSTGANRLAGPTGLSYTEAFLPADAVPVRNGDTTLGVDSQTLAPAQFQPVWGEETFQPGMRQDSNFVIKLALRGET